MVLTASDHSVVACRRRLRLPRVNTLILIFFVVGYHPKIAYLFYTGLECLLE